MRCGSGKADRAFADTRHDVVSGCEVLNQNDPPTKIKLKPKSLTENSPVGTLVGRLKATDADPGDKHSFALVRGKGAGDNSSFTLDGKRLLTAAAVDFEADPSLSIRVRAQDIAGARYAKSLTVSVTDVAETPTPTPPAPCTNGTTIGEGAGRTFSEPGGGEYYVHNNNWNDNYGGTHVITACNYDNWYVTVNIPDHGDNAVEAYPNVHRDYDDIPLANISSADFAGVGPKCAGCIYNTAFDIWIGDGFSHELMIWTENWGQRPAGNQIATSTIGGHTYEVWRSGFRGRRDLHLCVRPGAAEREHAAQPVLRGRARSGVDPDDHLAGRLRRGDGRHQRHEPALHLHRLPHLRLRASSIEESQPRWSSRLRSVVVEQVAASLVEQVAQQPCRDPHRTHRAALDGRAGRQAARWSSRLRSNRVETPTHDPHPRRRRGPGP